MMMSNQLAPTTEPPSDLIRGPATTIAAVEAGPRVEPEGGSEFCFGLHGTLRGC
jgi:hypothetical protein